MNHAATCGTIAVLSYSMMCLLLLPNANGGPIRGYYTDDIGSCSFECRTLHRNEPRQGCAVNFTDCGNCLEGYTREYRTDQLFLNCIAKSIKDSTRRHPATNGSSSHLNDGEIAAIVIAAIVITAGVVVACVFAFKYRNKLRRTRRNRDNPPSDSDEEGEPLGTGDPPQNSGEVQGQTVPLGQHVGQKVSVPHRASRNPDCRPSSLTEADPEITSPDFKRAAEIDEGSALPEKNGLIHQVGNFLISRRD